MSLLFEFYLINKLTNSTSFTYFPKSESLFRIWNGVRNAGTLVDSKGCGFPGTSVRGGVASPTVSCEKEDSIAGLGGGAKLYI